MKDEEWINPLYPSVVLLSYFNELPDPLLPSRFYDQFIEQAGNTQPDNTDSSHRALRKWTREKSLIFDTTNCVPEPVGRFTNTLRPIQKLKNTRKLTIVQLMDFK